MIIKSLIMTDFQVFQGRHEFDLSPRTKYNTKKPIILFGGKNGAGKTTTLDAIKLVLYGRQSLGSNISLSKYHDHLINCIHRSQDSLLDADSSSIRLVFTYATLGEQKIFSVERKWSVSGGKVTEFLKIEEDGSPRSEMSLDQCQGFLNELVPIGVSELFFFDGEKIKDLAEEQGGHALGSAIKKLLGLDLLETLVADLGIVIRELSKKSLSGTNKDTYLLLEKELNQKEAYARKKFDQVVAIQPKLLETKKNIELIETEILEKGGAWASTRESEKEKLERLSEERSELKKELQGLVGESLLLTKIHLVVRQNVSWRLQSSVTTNPNCKD